MKKIVIVFFLIKLLTLLKVNAQNYLIDFKGSGESLTVSNVIVENLSTGDIKTIGGSDILRLNLTTGVNSPDHNQLSELKIYPNPMTDNSALEFYPPEKGNAVITIVDITGKLVTRIQSFLENSRQDFRLSGMKTGFYLINVKGNNYQFTGKLISQVESHGKMRIEKIYNYNQSFYEKEVKENSKGTQTTVDMTYSTGNRLKFTGISGIFSIVKTDIPVSDKTIEFNFTACTDGDNNNYPVLEIGAQLWMAENLKSTTYINGDLIGTTSPATLRLYNESTPKYQWSYDGNESNVSAYGRLYTWYAATDSRSICPTGWHIPADADWKTLTDYLGGTTAATLKIMSTKLWATSNNHPTNESGFTALPGGDRHGSGVFHSIGDACSWWSGTEKDASYAWNRNLYYINSFVGRWDSFKDQGFSVRCLKDN
jgi:uncharacterized protein (TIGR02145 family)